MMQMNAQAPWFRFWKPPQENMKAMVAAVGGNLDISV